MDINKLIKAGVIVRSKEEKQRELQNLSETLWRYGRDETTLESYIGYNQDNPDFFEENSDLLLGNGLMLSTTKYEELQFLWAEENLYVPAEAQLVHFHQQHGQFVNIICAGSEMGDPAKIKQLSKVAFRHQLIGLTPLITPSADLSDILRRHDLNCDVFVTINGEVAYLFSFFDRNIIRTYPLFFRTTYNKLVVNLENEQKKLRQKAISYDKFCEFRGAKLNGGEQRQVEKMAQIVLKYTELLFH